MSFAPPRRIVTRRRSFTLLIVVTLALAGYAAAGSGVLAGALFLPPAGRQAPATSAATTNTPTSTSAAQSTPRAPTSPTPAVAAPPATATPTASATRPPSPTPSPSPAPATTAAPSPTPPTQAAPSGNATIGYAVTSQAAIQAEPDSESAIVGSLSYEQPIALLDEARGERVVVGDQDWPMAIQDWSDLWYQVDGGYVYAAYVWVPGPGEVLPDALPRGTRSVDVDLATQTASLLVGGAVVYQAPVTSGKDGYDTPTGVWHVAYQVLDETMTSAQAGINAPGEQYDVQNVLFTQYFDYGGDALHLNYWQPESTFGNRRSSHGCVGLFINDAQYFWLFGEPGMEVDVHDGPDLSQASVAPGLPLNNRGAAQSDATTVG